MRNRGLTPVIVLLAALVLPVRGEDVVPWDEADAHVGEEATVEGEVVDVHCSPLSCLLAFEPSFNGFTAVVQARSFDVLPPDTLAPTWVGRRVRVSGRIRSLDGKPEIVVESPDALRMAPGEAERLAEAEARAGDAKLVDRLQDVLGRIEELSERLAATQERLDATIARLEQHEAALARLPPPSLPRPPATPQPERPRYEALRSIKRGMSARDVERLVGRPEYVEQGGNGWTIWYYDSDRSISFDARGRAHSFVGFSE